MIWSGRCGLIPYCPLFSIDRTLDTERITRYDRYMNKREQKANRQKILMVTIGSILGIALMVGGVYFMKVYSAADSPDDVVESSPFTFDVNTAPGWWQGATDSRSIVAFNEQDSRGCFASLERRDGVVDVDRELGLAKTQVESSGQYSFESIGVKDFELATSSGSVKYQLHFSRVVSPEGADEVKRGQSFGYAQLADGYVKVMALCDAPEQLESVYPALAAFRVDL